MFFFIFAEVLVHNKCLPKDSLQEKKYKRKEVWELAIFVLNGAKNTPRIKVNLVFGVCTNKSTAYIGGVSRGGEVALHKVYWDNIKGNEFRWRM